jgi:hypothetical protein
MLAGQVIKSTVDQLDADTSGDGEIMLAVYTPHRTGSTSLG